MGRLVIHARSLPPNNNGRLVISTTPYPPTHTPQVSLAFLGRGEGEPLMSYLPSDLQQLGAFPQLTAAQLQEQLSHGLAQQAVQAIPTAQQSLVGQGARLPAPACSSCPVPPIHRLGCCPPLSRAHRLQLQQASAAAATATASPPTFSSAFWALLIVVTCTAMMPLAAARASTDAFTAGLASVTTIFMGSVVIVGYTVEGLTLPLFWSEVRCRAASARPP